MSNQNVVKNITKADYYQLIFKGNSGGVVYDNDIDYKFFLLLLEKYLFNNDSVRVLAYCLTPDHFSLLMNQTSDDGVKKFVKNIVVGYNLYYFDEYGVGDVINDEDYEISAVKPDDLLNVSRRVHVAADNWLDYPLSSIRAYLYDDKPTWLDKTYIADVYGSAVKYLSYLKQNGL
ncbi:MAG: hypothetical protein WCH58_04350 [Candidatus Saccharibacteria bacterium]